MALGDLTCLKWALISPLLSSICFLSQSPETASKVANATVEAVKSAANDVKELIEFDLTHNPIAIGYTYATTIQHAGSSRGNNYLGNVTRDFAEVSMGIAKESVNQGYALYNLWQWNDYAHCVIRDAAKQAIGGSNRRRRGLEKRALSDIDAAKVMKGCLSDKFSKGPVFNISAGNEHVGATIFDFATLLIPVGPEAEAIEAGATVGFDLALTGAEDTTRILKQSETAVGRAEHFASEEEAARVAKSLEEEGWQSKNCAVCGTETLAPVRGSGNVMGTSRRSRIKPRGGAFSMCCNPSAAQSELDLLEEVSVAASQDSTSTLHINGGQAEHYRFENNYGEPIEEEVGMNIFDPKKYNIVAESDLVEPIEFEARDVFASDSDAAVKALWKDLGEHDTGLTPFSAKLKSQMGSREILRRLRDVFTGSPDDPLYKALKIRKRDNLGRMTSLSKQWNKPGAVIPEVLEPFKAWSETAGNDLLILARKLDPYFEKRQLQMNTEIFWVPPGDQALLGADPRGLHVDGAVLAYGTADTPGLVIQSSATEATFRVKPVEDGLHLMKGDYWSRHRWGDVFRGGGMDPAYNPTQHGVWGPEMAEKGRLSIVVIISE